MWDLQNLQDKGKFKSQKGGNETVLVKNEVPWLKTFVLGGCTKSRISYDQLTMSQWVVGFCYIIKDEQDVNVKNCMLDYMGELMEDCQDFGWLAAKGSLAVLLVKKEEGKVKWEQTHKLDRIHRAHAQKVQNNQNGNAHRFQCKDKAIPCKLYHKGSFSHRSDDETSSQMHLHVCSN